MISMCAFPFAIAALRLTGSVNSTYGALAEVLLALLVRHFVVVCLVVIKTRDAGNVMIVRWFGLWLEKTEAGCADGVLSICGRNSWRPHVHSSLPAERRILQG